MLHVLVKLSLVKAKIFLREEVLEEDVNYAHLLYEEMLENQVLSDSIGNFDRKGESFINNKEGFVKPNHTRNNNEIDRTDIGGLGKQKQTKIYLEELSSLVEATGQNTLNINELKRVGQKMRMNVGFFQDFIDNLNHKGILLKKANSVYEFLGLD